MSRLYHDDDDWLTLGRQVYFNGPDGERLHGEIARTSSNPTYFHVEVFGQRYEVDLHADNMRADI